MEQRPPYPGIGHALLMTLTFVGLQFVLVMPFQIVMTVLALAWGMEATSAVLHPVILAWVNTMAIGAVVGWGLYQNRAPWQVVLPLRPIGLNLLLAIGVTTCGVAILLSEIDNLFRRVLPMPDFMVKLFQDLLHQPEHMWAMAFLLVIVAPATEEPLFRGVILRGFLGRGGPAKAILISSLLFGLAHMNPWQFVSATLLGFVFGWWYLRTRSLVPGLIGHALANGLVFSAASLPFRIEGFNDLSHSEALNLQPLWFDALGMALTAVGVGLFRRWTPNLPAPEPALEPPPVLAPPPIRGEER